MDLGTVEQLVAAICHKRADLGLSIDSLSLLSGVNPGPLIDLEDGVNIPGIRDVLRILKVLGIHATRLPSVPQPVQVRLADINLEEHMKSYETYGVQGPPATVWPPFPTHRPKPRTHPPRHS